MSEVENFGKLTPTEKRRVFACFLALPPFFLLWPSVVTVLIFCLAVVAVVYIGRWQNAPRPPTPERPGLDPHKEKRSSVDQVP